MPNRARLVRATEEEASEAQDLLVLLLVAVAVLDVFRTCTACPDWPAGIVVRGHDRGYPLTVYEPPVREQGTVEGLAVRHSFTALDPRTFDNIRWELIKAELCKPRPPDERPSA
jgi:hypothetical protein